MTLGTGIFSSAVMLATVFLFSITKDRWNWWKGLKRIGITLLVIVCCGIGLYYAWEPLKELIDRPKPFQEFAGIKLGSSQADVKYLKGLPENTCTDPTVKDWSQWSYRLTPEEDLTATYLVVIFKGTHGVWSIYITSPVHKWNEAPELDHVNKYATFESIDKRFGPASSITPSKDGLSRTYAYRRYNLRVKFSQGHLTEYGIFYHPGERDIIPLAPESKRDCVDEKELFFRMLDAPNQDQKPTADK